MFALHQSDLILVFERAQNTVSAVKSDKGNATEPTDIQGKDEDTLKEVIDLLYKGGLEARIYQIHDAKLGIFIHCPTTVLYRLWAQMRISDFVYNVGTNDPLDPPKFVKVSETEMQNELRRLPRSTRIYLITNLLISPKYQGGLGLSWTEEEEFAHPNLKSLVIPHDQKFTKVLYDSFFVFTIFSFFDGCFILLYISFYRNG